MVFVIQLYLFFALGIIACAIEGFAFFDATRHSAQKFVAENKRTKKFWLLCTGISLGVGVYSTFYGLIFNLIFINLIAVTVSCVYLADVRRSLINSDGKFYNW